MLLPPLCAMSCCVELTMFSIVFVFLDTLCVMPIHCAGFGVILGVLIVCFNCVVAASGVHVVRVGWATTAPSAPAPISARGMDYVGMGSATADLGSLVCRMCPFFCSSG